MAGERVKLVVSNRAVLGSAESRRLRRRGLIPGVLYGREEPVAISVPERDLRAALTTGAGLHAVLDVVVDTGKTHASVLKEWQLDRVRGVITHVDLQEVRLDRTIQTSVSVTLVGEPAGVKEGGVLSQVTTEINIEALPLEIPQHLEVDISQMQLGDTLRLDALEVPEGVTLVDDPTEIVLATVTQPTRVEEPEEALAEGEEPALEGVPAEERPESATESPGEPAAPAAGGEGTTEG